MTMVSVKMRVLLCSTVNESNSITHWTVDRSIDFLETRTRPARSSSGRVLQSHAPYVPIEYWYLYDSMSLPEPVYGDYPEMHQRRQQVG